MSYKYVFFFLSDNEMDYGSTCLRMVTKHSGKHYNADSLRQKSGFNKAGVSLPGVNETAERTGFRTKSEKEQNSVGA